MRSHIFCGTSQQPLQKANTASAKGKEVIGGEQETMAGQPDTSKEQGQGQGPSTQTNVPEIPVLQTPLNEERTNKRERHEDTPGSAQQQGEKRQRLNPYSEEEFLGDTTGNLGGEKIIEQ